jgi:carboxymethylenebutenolidase
MVDLRAQYAPLAPPRNRHCRRAPLQAKQRMPWIDLKSCFDGATLPAYAAPAIGSRRGGLLLVQEIFGVNANMRALADRFAADGYDVLAPAFFARIDPAFDAGFDEAGYAKARAAVAASSWAQVAADCQTAIDALAGDGGPVYAAGFCWGGTVAWLAACRCTGLAAASGFYGRMIIGLLDETPRAPIALHYGERDPHIPLTDVDQVRAAHPNVPIYLYPAGHGFFSDRGGDHDPVQADLAWARTRALFDANT